MWLTVSRQYSIFFCYGFYTCFRREIVSENRLFPIEKMIRLFINGAYFSRILCTPHDLKELVIGWLYTQQIVDSPDDIDALGVCDSMTDVSIKLGHEIGDVRDYDPVTSSGCGGGEMNARVYSDQVSKLDSDLSVEMSTLKDMLSKLFGCIAATEPSQGIHGALIIEISSSSREYFSYDIGRHNAVDKVIGAGLLHGIDFCRSVLIVSGRVSSDMTLKAIRAKIPVLVSPRSVTSMAAEIADMAGIAIIGRMAKQDQVLAGIRNRVKGVAKQCPQS